MSDDWADPVRQMAEIFSKDGLKQACFERDLPMHGDKADLAARLYGAGYSINHLMTRKS